MKFKKYFLSKFVNILSIEDSYFFKIEFNKKVKLTDELIDLNYKKYSPYKNPYFTTLMEDKNLYIWFYEKKLNGNIIIPEAYLLFDLYKEKNPNSLLYIESNGTFIVIIIKDKILENSYSLFDVDEDLISMEMNRYALTSLKKIDKQEYLRSRKEAVENIGFKELYKWNNLELDNTTLLPQLVNSLAYPIAFLLFFIMGVEIYHANDVEKRLTSTEERYSVIKSKNDDIREKINYENENEKKWVDFAQKELPFVDPIEMFMRISKAFSSHKVTFTSFSIVGSTLKITIKTKEDFIVGVNILNSIKGLKNIALKYSNKKRETASYEATLEKGLSL